MNNLSGTLKYSSSTHLMYFGIFGGLKYFVQFYISVILYQVFTLICSSRLSGSSLECTEFRVLPWVYIEFTGSESNIFI